MRNKLLTTIVLLGLLAGGVVCAQNSVSLTITPPLIKINMKPGESWSSSIKIVNNNSQTLPTYTNVMDFKSGEEGGVQFIKKPGMSEDEKIFLSEWIEIESGPIKIPPFQSKEIPFTIRVPEEAEPGGHYAAILAGTQPSPTKKEGAAINVASRVTSLILLNIQGDVEEKGWIREFSTGKDFYQKPEVDLTVSFENQGNVHLHPVGQIKIYNMWDKERGVIPINEKTEFGNVLPDSKKTWHFQWKGEESPFEFGRYKAQLFLGFGQQGRQTVSSTLYFWVIPIVPVAGITGTFILFLLALVIGIRAYIRKAILLAQKEAGLSEPSSKVAVDLSSLKNLDSKTLQSPIREAMVDLREVKKRPEDNIVKFGFLLKKYHKFTLFFLMLLLWGGITTLYLNDILETEKGFEVSQTEGNKEMVVSSRDVFKAQVTPSEEEQETEPEKETSSPSSGGETEESFSLAVLNGSGVPRAAALTAELLEREGFSVITIGNADSFNYKETIIQYKKGKQEEAGRVRDSLPWMGELREKEGIQEDVIVIIGKDHQL